MSHCNFDNTNWRILSTADGLATHSHKGTTSTQIVTTLALEKAKKLGFAFGSLEFGCRWQTVSIESYLDLLICERKHVPSGDGNAGSAAAAVANAGGRCGLSGSSRSCSSGTISRGCSSG